MSALCKLCEKKRAKRYCPGSGGEICPSCCGSEREISIDCPLDCDYLREARAHERSAPLDAAAIPNTDIKLTEKFVREHEPILMFLCFHLRRALEKNHSVDSDAREAIESMIQTYRTREAGLIYESRSPNIYAAGLQEELKKAIEELHKMLAEQKGMETLRDTAILGCLVFLQRLELEHSNGRRRGRAFLDFLRASFPVKAGDAGPAAAPASDEPLVRL